MQMGLHTGTSHERDDNYFGPEVNLAARVMSAAWGGQVLCTDVVARVCRGSTTALGDHSLPLAVDAGGIEGFDRARASRACKGERE